MRKETIQAPVLVYRFLREIEVKHLQFLPLVEPQGDGGVSSRTARPEAVGDFLCTVFDESTGRDLGRLRALPPAVHLLKTLVQIGP